MDDDSKLMPRSLDAAGRDLWRRMAPDHARDPAGRAVLEAFCFAEPWWRRAREVVEEIHDSTARTWIAGDGRARPHPAYAVEKLLAAEVTDLAGELGVTSPVQARLTPTRILFLDEGSE